MTSELAVTLQMARGRARTVEMDPGGARIVRITGRRAGVFGQVQRLGPGTRVSGSKFTDDWF